MALDDMLAEMRKPYPQKLREAADKHNREGYHGPRNEMMQDACRRLATIIERVESRRNLLEGQMYDTSIEEAVLALARGEETNGRFL